MDRPHASRSHAEGHAALSNLAHRVVGVLLGAVSILAALEFFDLVGGRWRLLWPALLVVVGLFVPLFILLAAREHWVPPAQVLADPQQRQHFVLSGLLLVGGLGQLLRRGGVLPGITRFLWPAVLVVVGYLFLAHTQHGTSAAVTQAVRAHRLLGGTLMLAGVARWIELIVGVGSVLGLAWIVLLLAAAIQFVMYREPEGAYAPGEAHGHTGD